MKLKASTISTGTEIDLKPIQTFIREYVIPSAAENDANSYFDHKIVNTLYEMKLLNCITPKQHGGLDYKVSDLICIARELGYGSAGVGATFIGNLLGYSPFVLYAKEDLKKTVCTDFIKNFGLWSFGMTEKSAGSDLVNIKTRAKRVEGGFLLNGEKNFITNANHSTNMTVFANIENSKGELEGITCFYVPGNSEGLVRGQVLHKLGWRESNTGYLHFNNVFIPAKHQLGNVGEGLKILTHCLNRSKTLLAAVAVGVSMRALDLVKEHLLNTERHGKPLLDQSVIRHLLARLYTKLEASWLLICSSASTWDSGETAVKEASMAKMFAATTSVEITCQVTELFGARGFMMDCEASRLYRDAKGIEIVEGPTLVQELLIAREVLPKTQKKQSDKKPDLFVINNETKKAA